MAYNSHPFTNSPSVICIHFSPSDPYHVLQHQPRQTQLENIPERVTKNASKHQFVTPKDDDDEIRNSLKHVWMTVQGTLEVDPKTSKGHTVSNFLPIYSLKTIAESVVRKRFLGEFFEGGTLFSSLDPKRSDRLAWGFPL